MDDDHDSVIAEKLLGWLLSIAFAVAGILMLSALDNWHDTRSARILEQIPERLAWWRTDVDASWLPIVLCFAPFLIIPGAFGVQSRQLMPRLSQRHRVWLLSGLAGAMVLAMGAYAFLGGHGLGVATADGVRWLHDGVPRVQRPWSEATGVEVGCDFLDEDASSEAAPSLTSQVKFPDDRSARLSLRTTSEDMGDWIARVEPIDERLRAAGVPRSDSIYKECLTHYGEGLIPSERARFLMILGVY